MVKFLQHLSFEKLCWHDMGSRNVDGTGTKHDTVMSSATISRRRCNNVAHVLHRSSKR
jgi:hypothetical protein